MYYVAIFAVATAMLFAAYEFAPAFAERVLSGGGRSGASVVVMIMPPLLVAQAFYKHEQRRMRASEGWTLALIFAVISFALSAAALWAGLASTQTTQEFSRDVSALWGQESRIMMGAFAALAVFLVLTNKLMLWSGIRGEIKKAERLAAKAAKKTTQA